MEIYIPSYQRSNAQITLASLSPALRRRTTIVVRPKEASLYRERLPKGVRVAILPEAVRTIGETRQWIMDNAKSPKLMMLDDDMTFYVRRTDDPTKIKTATVNDVERLYERVKLQLDHNPAVGCIFRSGANREPDNRTIYATRMLSLLAYRVKGFERVGARFDRLPFMEDFDVTLTFLLAGEANAVICDFAQGHPGSNRPGGCTESRTVARQATAARALAKQYPHFVKLRKKTAQTFFEGAKPITDVTVYWKKAYECGLETVRQDRVRASKAATR